MYTLMNKLTQLYAEMQKSYEQTAELLDFSCRDCPDNCCNSYFLHHTYIEWAYLRQGFSALPPEQQAEYLSRATDYRTRSEQALAAGQRPQIMCPINNSGRCGLYSHRLLICRLHGVPASMTFPNGRKRNFPGCFRCQEITAGRGNTPAMDRTLFFNKMLQLERELVGPQMAVLSKVKMTLSDMLLKPLPDSLNNAA